MRSKTAKAAEEIYNLCEVLSLPRKKALDVLMNSHTRHNLLTQIFARPFHISLNGFTRHKAKNRLPQFSSFAGLYVKKGSSFAELWGSGK